jgi:hypothetical protein
MKGLLKTGSGKTLRGGVMKKSFFILLSVVCLMSFVEVTKVKTVTASNSEPAAARKKQEQNPIQSQSEWRALKQAMDRSLPTEAQLEQYKMLLERNNPPNELPKKGRRQGRIRAAGASPCISDALTAGGATFSRPQLQDAPPGFVQPCQISMTGSNVLFKAYEFNVSGCNTATLTANLCGTGACGATGTLADSVLLIYQKPDASPATPASPIFNPTAPCTNIIAANDDFCTALSQVSAALGVGNFVVVVTSFTSSDTGTFNLSVDVPGCTVTQVVSECTLTCPANITQPNDPNQCGAVVSFTAPSGDACGTVTCSPDSGSVFPVGMTTVTCTSATGPNCTFTVTVQDTQPPTITCPANITASESSPGAGSAIVNFAPQAGDNCTGVSVSCTPASGSSFPVGTTSVSCTATDVAGGNANCGFTVTVNTFTASGTCLQDDSNPGNVALFDPATGQYTFCCNGQVIASGVGTLRVRGSVVTIEDYSANRRVLIRVDLAVNVGSAAVQSPPGQLVCTITDRNTTNNSCACGVVDGGTVILSPPTPRLPKKSKRGR